MIKSRKPVDVEGVELSPGRSDPWCRLAGAILAKTYEDVLSRRPEVSLEALYFLTSPACALMVSALDIEADPLQPVCTGLYKITARRRSKIP